MTDQATNDADAAMLDTSASEPGQDAAPADILAAIDPSVAAAAPTFISPGDGGIVRVSTDADGNQANGPSFNPALSRNGRFVAFESAATDLVPDEGKVSLGIFVKDLRTGQVQFASAGIVPGEGAGPASYFPSLSANGRFVAFDSQPVPGVGSPEHNFYVYVEDLRTGQLTLASADADGTPGNHTSEGAPSLSASGRFVAFSSSATNLVPGGSRTNEVFVKDLRTGQVQLASTDAAGNEGNGVSLSPSISANGRFVAFDSGASNLAPGADGGVFVKDLRSGQVTLASADAAGQPSQGYNFSPSISGDGRFVAFASYASDLVPGDADSNPVTLHNNRTDGVFLKDLRSGQVTLLSAAADGTPGDDNSSVPAISPNGRFVAFESRASNLVPGQAPGDAGVFLKDLWTGELRELAVLPPFTVDQSPHGTFTYTEGVTSPAVTNKGVVAFSSSVDLVPSDPSKETGIYLAS